MAQCLLLRIIVGAQIPAPGRGSTNPVTLAPRSRMPASGLHRHVHMCAHINTHTHKIKLK